MGKILVFKQHFFKYINKAEYTIAVSSVLGTIATTMIQSYSSYLSDRNARIERINNKPLNRIYVDYISFEQYQKMIDRTNWKPISEKIQKQKKEQEEQENKATFEYKKKEAIKSINSWLANKTKKNQLNNNEIDDESLKKLAEINGRAYEIEKQNYEKSIQNGDTNGENVDVNSINSEVSKISEITGTTKKNVLPPSKKKKEEMKYFVVQDAGGLHRYNPITYKKNHMKQNIQLQTKDRKVEGKIGNKDIVKDDNIWKSLYNIWAAFLYKKDPKKNGQIINSRYDQYGNKIKGLDVSGDNLKKKVIKKDDKEKDKNEIENNEKINENESINENEEIEQNNVKKEETINFVLPKFVIDQKIENIEKYNSYVINTDISNVISRSDLEMLMYLEYTIENCWYQSYTKKGGKNINSRFTITYSKTGKLKDIKMNYFDKEVINRDLKQSFVKNLINVINSCDITNIKNLTEKNYDIWGKIKIEFQN